MSTRMALVTGGTRGIGLGIARALARDGWSLVLGGTRPESDVLTVLKTSTTLRPIFRGETIGFVSSRKPDVTAAARRTPS